MTPTRSIRKISIGSDYKNAMHYIQGQRVLGDDYIIHLIRGNPDTRSVEIWVCNNKSEVVLWKEISSMVPHSIEYNIDF